MRHFFLFVTIILSITTSAQKKEISQARSDIKTEVILNRLKHQCAICLKILRIDKI